MNIKFGVFWKQNLGTIYKDNSITTLGKEADVDLNLSEVSSIHANFKVDGKNYTSIVYIVDIEKGLIRIPFTREVLSIGMHELELVAVMKNGDVIPSQTFTYNIVESLDNLEDITEETNYPILIQLLQDVNSKIAEIDDAIARIPSPEELKGEKGDKGDKGEQGIQGERGLQGIQGIRGEKGDKGDRGLQGIQGVKGEKGDKGERGERGLQGIQGNQGARGIQGEKGDKGETGVGLGFEWSGTKLGIKKDTDISYSYVELKGDKGEQGAKGEKGDTPSIAHLEQQVADKSKELDTKFNTLTAKQQQDAEVVTARDGEVSLNARLERDLEKGKIHFVDVEGSNISTESEEGYLENVEIHGNTWQNAENLEDIRSVGDKVEGQELYKIDVVNCGKNLYNMKNLEQYILSESDGMYEVNLYTDMYNNGIFVPTHNNVQHAVSIKAKLGTATNFRVDFVYANGEFNSIGYITTNSQFTEIKGVSRADNKLAYIRFNWSTAGTVFIKDFQLEEGTTVTPYEPYQEDKLTILSPAPLEKVGDIADRIICKDGVYGIEKNVIDDAIKNMSFGFNPSGEKENTVLFNYTNVDRFFCDDNRKYFVLSNIFAGEQADTQWGSDIESIAINKNNTLLVRINKNKLTSLDTKGFRDWLDKNNLIIKKITTQPTFIPLPHDQQIKLRTFADRTHIHFNTEIQPTLKAQVPKSLGATVNSHTSQIDNLNKELDRVKKLEESTVSTVTTDKAFATVSETNQGYFEDVKIEGKTLVNLAKRNKFKKTTVVGDYHIGDFGLHSDFPIDSSKEYTYIINVIKNTSDKDLSINDTGTMSSIVFTYLKGVKVGINVFKVKVREGKTITNNSYWGTIGLRGATVAGEVEAEVIILEGDHTDKDISFFEGLKSVGQGVDEISVSSSTFEQYKLEQGAIDYQGNIASSSLALVTDFIPVHQNIIYKIADNLGIGYDRIAFYDRNKNFLYRTDSYYGSKASEIKAIANSCFMKVSMYRHTPLTVENLPCIEISTRQDKKQILYYNPTTQTWEKPILREWDSIEKHSNGKYYYHKRSEEVLLDGSESWKVNNETTNNIEFVVGGVASNMSSNVNNTIFDKFKTSNSGDYERAVIAKSNYIYITISKSKLSTQDVTSFKQWLQTNNVTAVHQLAKEEVYECTNLDLITYSGETNLIISSGAIQPKLTLKVLSNVSNVVKLLQEKVSILENKFIKGLQQVLAGDMMSLAHLLYPEDFENNHEIQTLEL